ncbi:hypothetical protein, partial [Burkholderia ubonensis]|uniref:hypothetical protein n=1 Tax=Burkholderia ubonensis TaxID=101571 RepID=UPI001E47B485
QRSVCRGNCVRFALESAFALAWNTHFLGATVFLAYYAPWNRRTKGSRRADGNPAETDEHGDPVDKQGKTRDK